jgi:hypothetical protein
MTSLDQAVTDINGALPGFVDDKNACHAVP